MDAALSAFPSVEQLLSAFADEPSQPALLLRIEPIHVCSPTLLVARCSEIDAEITEERRMDRVFEFNMEGAHDELVLPGAGLREIADIGSRCPCSPSQLRYLNVHRNELVSLRGLAPLGSLTALNLSSNHLQELSTEELAPLRQRVAHHA